MSLAASFGLSLLGLFVLPVLVSGCLADGRGGVPWYEARRDPTGLAPDPATTPEAVVQVYAARAVSWRGVFSVHTWIAVKPTGAERYTRYEVLGFGVANGAPAVRVDRTGPDNYWFGDRPQIILDRRGARCRRADRGDPRRGRPLSLSARVSRLARPQQQHLHRVCCPRGPRARPRSAVECDRQRLPARWGTVCRRTQRLWVSGFALRSWPASCSPSMRGSSSTSWGSISASTPPCRR